MVNEYGASSLEKRYDGIIQNGIPYGKYLGELILKHSKDLECN